MRLETMIALPLIAALASCGTPDSSDLASVWDSEAWRAEQAVCRVRGDDVRLSEIHVRADNGTWISPLRLLGMPATIELGDIDRRGLAVPIEADGMITFRGELQWPVSTQIAAAVETADGMLTVGPGATLHKAYSVGSSVVGEIDIGSNATIDSAPLPCAALTLDEQLGFDFGDEEELDEDTPPRPIWRTTRERCVDPYAPEDGPFIETPWRDANEEEDVQELFRDDAQREEVCESVLNLHARPGGGDALTLSSEMPLYLESTDEDGNWLHVTTDLAHARVRGWVHRSDVEQTESITFWGRGGFGCCFCCGLGWARGGPAYTGPAMVTAGTRILADEDENSAWATIRIAAPYQVRHQEGSAWVRLMKIPGVEQSCGRLRQAFVPFDAVTLPDDAEYR